MSDSFSPGFSFEQFNGKKGWKEAEKIELEIELARQKPKIKLERKTDQIVINNIDAFLLKLKNQKKSTLK